MSSGAAQFLDSGYSMSSMNELLTMLIVTLALKNMLMAL